MYTAILIYCPYLNGNFQEFKNFNSLRILSVISLIVITDYFLPTVEGGNAVEKTVN